MRYLPILEELFESDTVMVLMVGLAASLLLGFNLKSRKTLGAAAGISALVYGICEAALNLHGSFMVQIILLILGTAALGGLAGFGLYLLLMTGIGRWAGEK